jgi:hypothetical protein
MAVVVERTLGNAKFFVQVSEVVGRVGTLCHTGFSSIISDGGVRAV